MSEEKNDPNPAPTPAVPVPAPIAMFASHPNTRLLLSLFKGVGGSVPVFQLLLGRAPGLDGAPNGTISLEQAIAIRALLDEGIKQGIAMNSLVFEQKEAKEG